MNPHWFYSEFDQGEDEFQNYAVVTDEFFAVFTQQSYTGFYPTFDIEKQFVFHSYADGPEGFRCKNSAEALKRFEEWEPVLIGCEPKRYQKLMLAFGEIFLPKSKKSEAQ
jgi:hypothetical protein